MDEKMMDQPAPQGGEQEGDVDPMKALGVGISAMVEGFAKAPPEVAQAAQAVGAAFQNLMQVLSGGPKGVSPNQDAMGGGNPAAEPVR